MWRYLRLPFENGDHDSDEGSQTTQLRQPWYGSFHQNVCITSFSYKARQGEVLRFNISIFYLLRLVADDATFERTYKANGDIWLLA